MKTKPTALKLLDWVSILALIFATYMSLGYAPMERVMGNVQRIFYFHVATGWVGFLSFLFAAVSGGIYLKTRNVKWDIISLAGVELGLMFSFINIVTGAIWARPIWNTWWTWDPRLVTATVMELVYFAYLMLRQGIENPVQRARFGAVYAILGFVSVPISYYSIRIWRSIHPVVIGNGGGEDAMGQFSMTSPMLAAFFTALIVFTIIFVDLYWHRIRLGQYQQQVEQRKMEAML